MAKKKTALGDTLFRNINPYGQSEDAQSPALLLVDEIRPDPNQPRRLLPNDLLEAVASSELTPMEAMKEWLGRDGIDNDRRFRELRRLADSIAQHGLINAITVREVKPDEELPLPHTVKHLIVTGERRYWSHVLLATEKRFIQEGDIEQEPTKIRATFIAEGASIRAHQLIENIMREDINAIEKANGLWALRYELSEVNHGSLDDISAKNLVQWKEVSQTLGISDRYRIYVTNVLNLSKQAQEIIEQHNLSERVIRPIVQKLKGQPDLQAAALYQVVVWQQESEAEDEEGGQAVDKAVEKLVDRLVNRAEKQKNQRASETVTQAADTINQARKISRQAQNALQIMSSLEASHRLSIAREIALDTRHETTVKTLRELREQIDDLLHQIGQFQSD